MTDGSRAKDVGSPARVTGLRAAYLRAETLWTVFLFVVSIGALTVSLSLDSMQAHDPLGARFFPLVASSLLVLSVCAVLLRPLVIMAFSRRAPAQEVATRDVDADGLLGVPSIRVAATMAVCIGYVALMDLLGYLPATILAMAGLMFILGTRRRRSFLIAPAATAIVVYVIFVNVLHVRLP